MVSQLSCSRTSERRFDSKVFSVNLRFFFFFLSVRLAHLLSLCYCALGMSRASRVMKNRRT